LHRGSWTWNGPYAEHRMKIWLDDIRPAPAGYVLVRSVNEAKRLISSMDKDAIEVVDCDHDLGDYASDGGDGIKLLDWLVETENFLPIQLHTANPVGRANMERLIRRYWE
jgi:hypothetical protein